MKDTIKQIIESNLPEKKENPKNKCINSENHLFGRCFSCEKNNGFNDCIEEINTSLIADEVLKVVVETYKEAINFAIDEINQDATYLIRDGAREGILKLVDYKLTNSSTLEGEQSEHLSPNKENKDNEKEYN